MYWYCIICIYHTTTSKKKKHPPKKERMLREKPPEHNDSKTGRGHVFNGNICPRVGFSYQVRSLPSGRATKTKKCSRRILGITQQSSSHNKQVRNSEFPLVIIVSPIYTCMSYYSLYLQQLLRNLRNLLARQSQQTRTTRLAFIWCRATSHFLLERATTKYSSSSDKIITGT